MNKPINPNVAEKKIKNAKIVLEESLRLLRLAMLCKDRNELLNYIKNVEVALEQLTQDL